MPTLNLNKYIEATSDVKVVIGDQTYSAPQLSFRQVIAYNEKLKELTATEDATAVLRVQREAILRRLKDSAGNPIAEDIVDNLPSDAMTAIFEFFMIAGDRRRKSGLPAEMIQAAEENLKPFIEKPFESAISD